MSSVSSMSGGIENTKGEPSFSESQSVENKKDTTTKGEIWLPIGSTLLDLVVGAGRGMGHEAGQLINLVSESQGGKTALCNEAIANAYHQFKDKFKWVYDGTCESGNTFNTVGLYGIEIIPKKGAVKSKTIQEAYCNIMEFLKDLGKDEFGIYVLDSIDAITSDEVEDISEERMKAHKNGKDYDKGSYQGQKPKFLSSEFLPKVASLAEEKNCLVIIVSQLRDNIGGGLYSPKDKVSNGRALLFYCSSRIWLKTKAEIERAGRQIGTIVEAETRKARGPKPYRKCFYIFYYEYGIDDVGGNIDFLYNLRTEGKGELAKRAANEVIWDGVAYSREDLIGHIEANGLESELKRRTIEAWDALETEASKETSSRKKRF